jgi:toxin-antitoxin system PIN domain toxin
MIAVDTNILVYAHSTESRFHPSAAREVRALAESAGTWAIPWTCLHEFYAVVTNPRYLPLPSTHTQALAQIRAWCLSPSVVLLSEAHDHLEVLGGLIARSGVAGPMVHDAKIAAICISHGVRELLTLDKDFSRFPEITTRSVIA